MLPMDYVKKDCRMAIAIGADHAGYILKEEIKKFLTELNTAYIDYGTDSTESVDYPKIAVPVARAVADSEADCGILICGTGIGMSIVANKIPGIRAALCYSEKLAILSRRHNNANVLTMGGRFIELEVARKIVKAFLNTEFETGGRHERRVKQIHDLTLI